ncbi:MAG: prepilin-type N-terminal cleavage/methylation domain-containing protein [Myxococcales bacterium]|nr:prepilin-type N-terminal cleavage/methylation domain-containing protein [Myxococcales bacterium]MCB9545380.1 prepilin-type N-terminal cleavage/methylation domain-containing protein [Myxococcales bacterium]
MSRRVRGFTLLEVMIAMAILILALTALLGHEGVAIQMSDFSNQASRATLLAQGKMLDLEHKLLKDSIDVLDNCESGDFRDIEMRKFEWEACAYKLEIEDGAVERLTEQVMALLTGFSGGGMDTGAIAGLAAAAQSANPDDPGAKMLGQIQMAVGAIPFFLQNLEDKVRKVRLVVKWKDAVADRTVILERFVTSLGVGQQAVKTDLPPDQVDPDDVAPKDDAPKDDAPKDTSK